MDFSSRTNLTFRKELRTMTSFNQSLRFLSSFCTSYRVLLVSFRILLPPLLHRFISFNRRSFVWSDPKTSTVLRRFLEKLPTEFDYDPNKVDTLSLFLDLRNFSVRWKTRSTSVIEILSFNLSRPCHHNDVRNGNILTRITHSLDSR